jgi:hypothetical protein
MAGYHRSAGIDCIVVGRMYAALETMFHYNFIVDETG